VKIAYRPDKGSGSVDHRNIDDLPKSCCRPLNERSENPRHGEHRSSPIVPDKVEWGHGHILGPDGGKRTAQSDVVDVVPGHRGIRTVLPPSCHTCVHETMVALKHLVRADAQTLCNPGSVRVKEYVSMRNER
jgi:hypothetical protein